MNAATSAQWAAESYSPIRTIMRLPQTALSSLYESQHDGRRDPVNLVDEVPWLNIAVIIVVAYVASLLTTYVPARQAAKVYPAEALRFE